MSSLFFKGEIADFEKEIISLLCALSSLLVTAHRGGTQHCFSRMEPKSVYELDWICSWRNNFLCQGYQPALSITRLWEECVSVTWQSQACFRQAKMLFQTILKKYSEERAPFQYSHCHVSLQTLLLKVSTAACKEMGSEAKETRIYVLFT